MDLTLEDVWRLLGQKELELAALRKEIDHLNLTRSALAPQMRPAPLPEEGSRSEHNPSIP